MTFIFNYVEKKKEEGVENPLGFLAFLEIDCISEFHPEDTCLIIYD